MLNNSEIKNDCKSNQTIDLHQLQISALIINYATRVLAWFWLCIINKEPKQTLLSTRS